MFGWKSKATAKTMRMMEMSGAYDGGLVGATNGLFAGTRIATSMGWRPVDAIAVGDLVLTFDNGMQRVTGVRRSTRWADARRTPKHMWQVHIPAGALGNYEALTVLPEQGLMVESVAAADQYGDPFAVVPAAALDGVRGITRVAPCQNIEIITLTFAADQVIYAEGNVLVHCAACQSVLDDMLNPTASAYDVLSTADAVLLAECLVIDDHLGGSLHQTHA